MANKVASIITLANRQFVVGNPIMVDFKPIEGAGVVEEITLNRADNAYNKGFQVPGASYTVKLEGLPIRHLVPFNMVNEVLIDTEAEDKRKKEIQPEAIEAP